MRRHWLAAIDEAGASGCTGKTWSDAVWPTCVDANGVEQRDYSTLQPAAVISAKETELAG